MKPPFIDNRFVRRFSLSTPVALAPMALATGGELAAACARAGALALVGGGYGDLEWTQREYRGAVNLLGDDAAALASRFGRILSDHGIPIICQIQTIAQLPAALEAGASVIVAQGCEAGGHGMNAFEGRSTFTLVPEMADWLARHAPETILLAAGGIADGRGLAASMMLGADGALIGSRLWATRESMAAASAKHASLAASGDDTARSGIFDILRSKNWPPQFDFRAIRNRLHKKWEQRIDELRSSPEAAIEDYLEGVRAEDYDRAHITVGEAIGLINEILPAEQVIETINRAAARLLAGEALDKQPE